MAVPRHAQLRARRAVAPAHRLGRDRRRGGPRRSCAPRRRPSPRPRPRAARRSAASSATSRTCPRRSATRSSAARSTASRTQQLANELGTTTQATKNLVLRARTNLVKAEEARSSDCVDGAQRPARGPRRGPPRVGRDVPPPRHLQGVPPLPRRPEGHAQGRGDPHPRAAHPHRVRRAHRQGRRVDRGQGRRRQGRRDRRRPAPSRPSARSASASQIFERRRPVAAGARQPRARRARRGGRHAPARHRRSCAAR